MVLDLSYKYVALDWKVYVLLEYNVLCVYRYTIGVYRLFVYVLLEY